MWWGRAGGVGLCGPGDRGNIYCPGGAPVARRERLKRAGAQYQHRAPGRANHKRRQQEYLARCEAPEKMTHRGSPGPSEHGHSLSRPADDPPERVPDRPPPAAHRRGPARCDFCGRAVREALPRRVAARRSPCRRGPRLPRGRALPPARDRGA